MSIKITAKLISAIRLKRPATCSASEDLWLAQEIERLNGIQSTIRVLENHKDEAKKEYDRVISDRDRRIAEIQKKCDHADTTYYPDPSGNNDSDTQCNICGKHGV